VADLNLLVESDHELKNKFEKETTEETQRVYHPYRSNFYLIPNSWVSYLKDNITGKIIGSYEGYTKIDNSSRKYNDTSMIELHPNYQGKRLCEPFSRMTYCAVVQKLGVQYLFIKVTAENKVGACRCYVGAALSCGLRCFLNGGEIFNKDSCSIYTTNDNSSLILTNNIDLDNDMLTKYNN
jgi:hypothetical protein